MNIKYLIIFPLLLLIQGCSLDEHIYDTPNAETFIESEADVSYLMNGVFAPLQDFACYKTTAAYMIFYSEYVLMSTTATYRDFITRSIASSNTYVVQPWGKFYQSINSANSLLKSVDESTVLSDDFKKRITGELSFMRAFVYFELVRLYGGVPLHTEPANGDSNFYPARNTEDEVYAQIFKDLEVASNNCALYSKQTVNEHGRPTKGAAQGIAALANLTYANRLELRSQTDGVKEHYQKAVLYADSVISSGEYSLIPNYADLFDVTKESDAYKEVIWGIQFTRDTKAANTPSRGSEWAYFTQPSTRYGVTGDVNGKGAAIVKVQPWYYDFCTTGDYANDFRSEVNFVTKWQYQNSELNQVTYPNVPTNSDRPAPELYPYINKYKDPNGLQSRNNENDWFYLRLAEIYLIKAEAINEVDGPVQEAYDAFNKVRERARMANGEVRSTPANLTGGLSKEDFRMKVFDERGVELFFEGKKWYDAVRTRYKDNKKTMIEYFFTDFYPNLPASERKTPSYSSATGTYGTGRVYTTSVSEWTRKYLLWPIPQTEIDANPNMIQNTEDGW